MTAPKWTETTARLGDLKPWAQNPRYSTKAQAQRILRSFTQFGQVQTVAVGPALEVYDGHQRLSALLTLHGPDYEIDARQASRALTDDERRELVVALHAGAVGQWDTFKLGGWDSELKTEWQEWKDEVAALPDLKDAAPKPPAEPGDDFEVETDDVLAPFPYFGGKSRVAGKVWARFGADVVNYVEPFCGSAAVLLQCPHELKVVTLNDADGMVVNFWRAIVGAPDDVAQAADWPVTEIDLFAREVQLVKFRAELTRRLWTDETYYDAKLAGWWVWGMCGTIGSVWCAGRGPWTVENGEIVKADGGEGVAIQAPHLGDAGRGVNRKLPHLGNAGRGVNRKLPHLGAGRGVNRKLPHLGNAGRGVNRKLPHLGNAGRGDVVDDTRAHFIAYMRALQNKLRRARVACGDWRRVVTDSVTHRHGLTAVFLDPPYGDGDMDYTAGGNADKTLARDVRAWAIEAGHNPLMRVALCGYDDLTMPEGWSLLRWKARKGYQSAAHDDSHREVIWFSPYCLSQNSTIENAASEE